MCITMESDLVFARESANALELIQKLIYQVISGPDGLGCFRDLAGLVVAAVVGTGAGLCLVT